MKDYDYIQANSGSKSSGTLQCFCNTVCEDEYDGSDCNDKTYGQADGDDICSFYNT